MHVRLFTASVLVLGLVTPAARAFRPAVDHGAAMVVGNPACEQDFPSKTAPDPRVAVVMCGLDNPRGLTFFERRQNSDDDAEHDRGETRGDEHENAGAALYVAEAGRGATDPSTSTECFTGQASTTPNNRCYGPTGAISRLWKGVQERVLSGLPSHANRLGRQAIGPHDIALVAGSRDCDPACAYVTIGWQQPPAFRAPSFLADFARLLRISASGTLRYVADFATYETQNNPDLRQLDTNPYSLVATEDGHSFVLTDAGGNSMLRVGADGRISTRAVFAPHPDDSVPTTVTVGPDGAYYVGELTGFPLVPNVANIYHIGRAGEPPEVCLTGFTAIIDIAFDRHANLYVLEYTGTLFRVTPDRRVTRREGDHQSVMCAQYAAGAQTRTTVLTRLTDPTSIAVGPDDAVYISNRGTSPGTGEVLRFEPLKIAFTRLREDVGIPGSDERLEAEIWVMNGDGSEPRRLTKDNSRDDLGAVWSPDGRTIAFYGTPFGRRSDGVIVAVGPPQVFLIDADGGETERPLVNGRFPSWSPDGKRIAFDTGGTSSTIFLINPDGTGLEQLTNAPGRNIRPTWSPDGRKIAFASGPNGSEKIYVMNADGSGAVELTSGNGPSWSPDGERIVFQTDRDGNFEIYSMNADGTDQTRLTDFHGRDLDADWSPDGRSIVFQRDIEPIEAQIIQVFVMNADGTHVRPLTGLPSENGHPSWGRERMITPRAGNR